MPQLDMSGVRETSHVEAPNFVPEGSRNWDLFRYACSLRARGVEEAAMLDRCLEVSATMDPPLPRGEVLALVRSAQNYDPGQGAAGLGRRRPVQPTVPPVFRVSRRGRPDLLPDLSRLSPVGMARAWVMALFEPQDVVCLCWDMSMGFRDGRGGEVHAYAGQLADPGDPLLGRLVTKCHDGLWGVVNPLDGSGKRRKGNVAAYRNLLVECDDLPADAQLERICALLMNGGGGLPDTRALTWSGGRSWHAVVRVRAKDEAKYAVGKEWVYAYCARNGLPVDTHCGNPTRFTRVAGGRRGDALQALAHVRRPSKAWDGGPAEWAERR